MAKGKLAEIAEQNAAPGSLMGEQAVPYDYRGGVPASTVGANQRYNDKAQDTGMGSAGTRQPTPFKLKG